MRVAGIGQGTDYDRRSAIASDLTTFRATQVAAQAAYRMAGFGPERVDVAELHDAFSPFEIISLEDTGLIPAGKAGRATLEGRDRARRPAAGEPLGRAQGARAIRWPPPASGRWWS